MFLEVLCKLGIFFPGMIQFEFSVYKQCAVVTNLIFLFQLTGLQVQIR